MAMYVQTTIFEDTSQLQATLEREMIDVYAVEVLLSFRLQSYDEPAFELIAKGKITFSS